ncbi:MAG: DUF6440 family protein [Candidatus Faecousia sp.]|nr:DUF6440 family protein [Candidatus Faecousia sp.]
MTKKEKRFAEAYSEGSLTVTKILVDKQTGVNYLFHASGYAGGLTPLLKADGTPVVTPVPRYEE